MPVGAIVPDGHVIFVPLETHLGVMVLSDELLRCVSADCLQASRWLQAHVE